MFCLECRLAKNIIVGQTGQTIINNQGKTILHGYNTLLTRDCLGNSYGQGGETHYGITQGWY